MPGVLHVCTANRCRSAIAERLLRSAVPLEVPVTSAGTRARQGEEIWPSAAVELARRRVSPLGFGSHPLTPALVAGADLVLTATRAHRDEVLATFPAARGHAFTWRELAWLVTGLDPAGVPGRTAMEVLAAVPAAAIARRGRLVPPPPVEFDIADPVEHGDHAVAEAATQIERALRPLIVLLAQVR